MRRPSNGRSKTVTSSSPQRPPSQQPSSCYAQWVTVFRADWAQDSSRTLGDHWYSSTVQAERRISSWQGKQTKGQVWTKPYFTDPIVTGCGWTYGKSVVMCMYNIHNIEILFAQGVLLDLTHRKPTKRKVKHCHMKNFQIKTALDYRRYLLQTVF